MMRAQAFGNKEQMGWMLMGGKTLEINPKHAVMVSLLKAVQANKDDATAKNTAAVLFQTALLESGFEITDPTFLVSNIYGLMSKSLGVDPEAPLAEIELPEEEEEAEAEEEEEEKADDSETDNDDEAEEEVVAEESESDKKPESEDPVTAEEEKRV